MAGRGTPIKNTGVREPYKVLQSDVIEKKYPYFFFTSVNRRSNPVLQKDEELIDLVNWYTDRIGSKKVRPGLTVYLDQVDSNPVTGLFYGKFPNSTIGKRLVRASGGKLYGVDPNVATGWGANIFSTSNFFKRPEATMLNAKMHITSLFSDTEAHYLEYNGTTATDTTYTSSTDPVSPYRGVSLVQYHQRVYVISPYDGTNLFRSLLSYSTVDYQNKGTTPASPWTTEAVVTDNSKSFNRQIDQDYKGGGIKVTNINNRLNIYKEEGIYRYNETSVSELFGLAAYQGSIATMEETKEDYFMTNEGFFKTTGDADPTPIGEGWYPILKQMLKNGMTLTSVVSGAVNYRYFCYVGQVTYDGKTLNHACFVYDARFDEMWLWDFAYDITCFGYYSNTSNDKVVLLGDANGNVYKLDESANDDAGTAMFASFKTHYYYFDDPTMSNWISEFYGFTSVGSELEIAIDRDYANQYTTIGVSSGFGNKLRVNQDKIGQFQQASFEITWNGKGKRPSFDGMVCNIKQSTQQLR